MIGPSAYRYAPQTVSTTSTSSAFRASVSAAPVPTRVALGCLALLLSLGSMLSVAAPVSAGVSVLAAPASAAQAPGDDTTAGETQPDDTEVDGTGAADGDDGDSDSGAVDAENRRILLIIIGLVAVAIALALLTIRYWRQTKPVPVTADNAGEDDEGRPAEQQGEDLTDVAGSDDPYGDLFEPVIEPSRRSRRAVAGADHADADELWVPRGTGEHDRIDVAEAPAISRPNAAQRAAAFRSKPDH